MASTLRRFCLIYYNPLRKIYLVLLFIFVGDFYPLVNDKQDE